MAATTSALRSPRHVTNRACLGNNGRQVTQQLFCGERGMLWERGMLCICLSQFSSPGSIECRSSVACGFRGRLPRALKHPGIPPKVTAGRGSRDRTASAGGVRVISKPPRIELIPNKAVHQTNIKHRTDIWVRFRTTSAQIPFAFPKISGSESISQR